MLSVAGNLSDFEGFNRSIVARARFVLVNGQPIHALILFLLREEFLTVFVLSHEFFIDLVFAARSQDRQPLGLVDEGATFLLE